MSIFNLPLNMEQRSVLREALQQYVDNSEEADNEARAMVAASVLEALEMELLRENGLEPTPENRHAYCCR